MVIRCQNTPKERLMAGEYLLAMREFALKKGINAQALMKDTDIDMSTLLNPPRHIPAKDVRQVGTNLVRALNDPFSSSIEFGRSMILSFHGALGIAVQGAQTLMEATDLLTKYMVTRSGINTMKIVMGQEYAGIILDEVPLNTHERDSDVQGFFNFAALVSIENILKELLSDHELSKESILHTRSEEPKNSAYQGLGCNNIIFKQDHYQLLVPLEWASLLISTSNTEIALYATEQCENDLQNYSSQELTKEISTILGSAQQGLPSLDEVAAHFFMSPSSLQRRLREKNTSFKQLKTDTLYEKARNMLADKDIPIENIATSLGFSDTSNFSKAFKGWSGLTPGRYREQTA